MTLKWQSADIFFQAILMHVQLCDYHVNNSIDEVRLGTKLGSFVYLFLRKFLFKHEYYTKGSYYNNGLIGVLFKTIVRALPFMALYIQINSRSQPCIVLNNI